MAKRKPAKTKSKSTTVITGQAIKETLLFELLGLVIFLLAIVGAAQFGVVGKLLVLFFRFFLGGWYWIAFVGMVIAAGYIMLKREYPNPFDVRVVGTYFLISAILIFSHSTLVNGMAKSGTLRDPSILKVTSQLYCGEAKGIVLEALTSKENVTEAWNDAEDNSSFCKPLRNVSLGGGMIGALLFATSYFLFDGFGTYLVALILILIGVTLISGKTLSTHFFPLLHKGILTVHRKLLLVFGEVSMFRQRRKERIDDEEEDLEDDEEKLKVSEERRRHVRKSAKQDRKAMIDEQEDVEEPVAVIVGNERKQEDVVIEQIPIVSMHQTTEDDYGQATFQFEEEEKKKEKSPEKQTTTVTEPTNTVETTTVQTAESNLGQIVEVQNKHYELPPMDLLQKPVVRQTGDNQALVFENMNKLQKTFKSFGVGAKVKKVHLGPAVTKYEVEPESGVKVSRIVNLSDDIALALAAKDIRIEAPIPGKSAIGIEVPNESISMVNLREVLGEGKKRSRSSQKLLIGLGRDISGNPVAAELNKMPHLLVAGATGSGKSVCINGIIVSILMRAKPHEVKLMMIDPKMVELNMYNGIPHLLMPVVTDPKKASVALKKAVSEMERRYELFSHSGTRNIEGYNEYIRRYNEDGKEKQPELPFIVVIVDELADLMMVASSDVEDCIMRLAQMARAAGIHLIIATQRPSVDVITGVIKANIPSRIAFSVSSQTDSRTILDMGGAEKLLGRGDMLFLPVGESKPIRVQGAFLSDEEVENVVNHCISQQKAQYNEEMMQLQQTVTTTDVEDDLYYDAVDLVVEMGTASVSMLQRRFRIGYTRAARLIDAMEARGVVGPYEGSKPREVLIQKQDDDDMQRTSS